MDFILEKFTSIESVSKVKKLLTEQIANNGNVSKVDMVFILLNKENNNENYINYYRPVKKSIRELYPNRFCVNGYACDSYEQYRKEIQEEIKNGMFYYRYSCANAWVDKNKPRWDKGTIQGKMNKLFMDTLIERSENLLRGN